MSATTGRDAIKDGVLQSDLDCANFKLVNADLSDSTNTQADPGVNVPTIFATTGILKGDGSGNATEATPLLEYWDGTVAFTTNDSSTKGLVPDPGANVDGDKFLCEDMTYKVPAGTDVPTIANSGILKGDGSGNAVAATAKTDYWDATVAVGSGASHAKGLVPDPPASSGTTKFLREDMTYAVPPASAGVTIESTSSVIKGDGAGGGVAAVAGTDFVAPSTALTRLTAATVTVSGATPNINWASSQKFKITLSANATFTFSNDTDGYDILIAITNTASNYTVTWPAGIKWTAATAPTQTVGAKTDLVGLTKIGTVIYGAYIQNLS